MPNLAVNYIKIPIEVISRNKLDRQHWSKKTKLRNMYQLLIRNQMKLNKIKKVEPGAVCNLVVIGYRKRELDFDNFVGGCKQLIDACSQEQYIWDDDTKHLGIPTFIQRKCEKGVEPYTMILRTINGQ